MLQERQNKCYEERKALVQFFISKESKNNSLQSTTQLIKTVWIDKAFVLVGNMVCYIAYDEEL